LKWIPNSHIQVELIFSFLNYADAKLFRTVHFDIPRFFMEPKTPELRVNNNKRRSNKKFFFYFHLREYF